MAPHLALRWMRHRQNPRAVTPIEQHRGPSQALAGRFEQFSLVENLVLKIIYKKYPVNHFKEKTKKCSGAIYEQKMGVKCI